MTGSRLICLCLGFALCLAPQPDARANAKVIAALERATHPVHPRPPEPCEVRGLNDATIEAGARRVGLPIYDVSTFVATHELALPLMENQLLWLLQKHEAQRPRYVCFRRDLGAYEDALVALAGTSELAKRVTSVNLSIHSKQADRHLWPEYLGHRGLSPGELTDSKNHFVFLDSGFRGSLFDHLIKELAGVTYSDLAPRFSGYLVYRMAGGHGQAGWAEPIQDTTLFTEMRGHYGHAFGQYWRTDHQAEQKVSVALAHYLQLMPKHTQYSGQFAVIAGRPHLVPSKTHRTAKTRPIDPVGCVNESIVDPVSALKLQARTVNYFSRPEVRQRVLPSALHKR